MKINDQIWNYETVSAFNDNHYKDLLTKKDVTGVEKMIKEVSVFETGDDGITIENTMPLNTFFFVLQKNGVRYLLESQFINKLPILVKDSIKVGYMKEGYVYIKTAVPVGFSPEKKFCFRDVVDNFAHFKHTNPNNYKLWKIVMFACYLDRANVRVCSLPAFGKGSPVSLIDYLCGKIGMIQKPTIAKLEYLTNNKLLFVDELVNLTTQETRDIEQYLLTVGDFRNKYEKRSRANQAMGGREEYDISKFSLVLAYNNLENYPDGDKTYFDFVHTDQIKQRYLPLKFDGKLEHDFSRVANPELLAKEYNEFYKDMARSIRYYSNYDNVRKELKPYPTINFDFKDRWRINFNTICKFINLYSNDEKEYKHLVHELFKCHANYISMINGNSIISKQSIGAFTNFEIKQIEESIE